MVELKNEKISSTTSTKEKEKEAKPIEEVDVVLLNANNDNTNNKIINEADEEKVDLELVGKLRDLIRKDYDNNKDKYSQEHYLDLMNPNSPATCWRYLLYSKLSVDDSFEIIKKSLAIRKEYDIDNIGDSKFPKEFWLYGPIHFMEKTNIGSEVVFVTCRDYRKANGDFTKIVIRYAINFLFGFDKKHINDYTKITFVFDTTNCGFRNIDLEFMSWLVGVIDYLPNRVEKVFVTGIPFILRPVVKLIISWLPLKLSSIVECGTFEDLVERNVNLDLIPIEAGGTADDTYRLAPFESPWIEDLAEMNNKKTLESMEYCLMGNHNLEKREELKKMQIDYDNKIMGLQLK